MTVKATAVTSALALFVSTTPLVAQDQQSTAKQDHPYELMVGDSAPELAISTWVKGDPVKSLEEGQVYVVEFWATWCGPCIAGMPHLSKLQEKYGDKVRIIGVNIWDDPANVEPFMENDAPIHNKPGNEIMRYTVAIEEKDDPDSPRKGVMSKTWMQAAGRNGIPSAFIVDRQGTIAWIGHPHRMDKPLAEIVEGKWDIAKAAKRHALEVADRAKFDKFQKLFRKGKHQQAYAIANELVKGSLAENPVSLNTIAWLIVDPSNKPETQDLDLALMAAEKANKLTDYEDPAILDTLAHVYRDRGNLAKAVELETKAVKLAEGPLEDQLRAALETFQREAAAKPAAGTKTGGSDG